jgi:integrase
MDYARDALVVWLRSGCSANQIAAITGHATLAEVQRYTKAADRKRMAREAMKKLVESGW